MSRSQTCKTWIQFSRTRSSAQEENNIKFITGTQKEENAGPHHQDEKDWDKNMGFTDTVLYLLLQGKDSRRRQYKDSLFFALLNYITESNRNKNFEEWLIYVEPNSSL